LIQGIGSSSVYQVKGGVKRHVPNGLSFNGHGLRWGDIDVLPASMVASVPTGNPLMDLKATGVLLSGSGTAVYVMENGAKRHIANAGAFNACGYAWDAIFRIDDALLNAVPTGGSVTGAPCPVYSPPDEALFTAGSSTVYVSRSGLKRPVPNIATFNGRGFEWGNLDALHPQYSSSLQAGRPILDILSDGQLLMSTGTAVYVTQGGTKRHIHTASLLTGCGYAWDSISNVGGAISLIPTGSPLANPPCPSFSAPDGTLVMGSGTAVYILNGGQRRLVTHPAVMATCGYLWGNIDQLPEGLVESIPAGPAVDVLSCP
jgi:hypothetical protein